MRDPLTNSYYLYVLNMTNVMASIDNYPVLIYSPLPLKSSKPLLQAKF